jgi:hypothetical protein
MKWDILRQQRHGKRYAKLVLDRNGLLKLSKRGGEPTSA